MKKPRSKKTLDKESGLEVRRICGYTAVRSRKEQRKGSNGWIYLRRHSETELFVGNLPQPDWFTTKSLKKNVSTEELQKRIKKGINRMVPGAEHIGDLFSTGNGRLATRIVMKGGKLGVEQVLDKPDDHLYVNWEELQEGDQVRSEGGVGGDGMVERLLREYEEMRDVKAVRDWSDAAMKAYELREKKKAEEKERQEREGGIPDEDGFVTVTHGAKQMKAAEAEKVGTRGKAGKGHYKSKSGKNRKALLDVRKGIEKTGFYRWQRENKSALMELQSKFKEDQKRIAAIRALAK